MGLTNSEVLGDTIYTTFALSDTIYRHKLDGTRLNPIPIKGIGFRSIMATTLRPAGGSNGVATWLASFSTITQAIPVRNGYVVQYADRPKMMPEWHLAVLDEAGTAQSDILTAPRFLGARDAESLLFVDPGSLPNKWLVSQLLR
jgi:hypothetical protein